MYYRLLFSLVFISCFLSSSAQKMNNKLLQEVIEEVSDSIIGEEGYWEFYIHEMPMLCISDTTHNRMRIITPVSEVSNLKKGQLKACMEANFHSALDVKYAISDDLIWVTFIHPLKELNKEQLRDAIGQVWNAAGTFGTTYSSTDLVFPGKKKAKDDGKKM